MNAKLSPLSGLKRRNVLRAAVSWIFAERLES
jgi:hypothetical protein